MSATPRPMSATPRPDERDPDQHLTVTQDGDPAADERDPAADERDPDQEFGGVIQLVGDQDGCSRETGRGKGCWTFPTRVDSGSHRCEASPTQ